MRTARSFEPSTSTVVMGSEMHYWKFVPSILIMLYTIDKDEKDSVPVEDRTWVSRVTRSVSTDPLYNSRVVKRTIVGILRTKCAVARAEKWAACSTGYWAVCLFDRPFTRVGKCHLSALQANLSTFIICPLPCPSGRPFYRPAGRPPFLFYSTIWPLFSPHKAKISARQAPAFSRPTGRPFLHPRS